MSALQKFSLYLCPSSPGCLCLVKTQNEKVETVAAMQEHVIMQSALILQNEIHDSDFSGALECQNKVRVLYGLQMNLEVKIFLSVQHYHYGYELCEY